MPSIIPDTGTAVEGMKKGGVGLLGGLGVDALTGGGLDIAVKAVQFAGQVVGGIPDFVAGLVDRVTPDQAPASEEAAAQLVGGMVDAGACLAPRVAEVMV